MVQLSHQNTTIRAAGSTSWLAISIIFFIGIVVDLSTLSLRPPTLKRSIVATTVWIAVAIGVGGYIWVTLGASSALVYCNGYVIEYLLSIDNLIVFHFILNEFATPRNEQPYALTFGLLGAIFLRLILCVMGDVALHHLGYLGIPFGILLIITAVISFTSTDETVDPKEMWIVKFLFRSGRIWPFYKDGQFFVKEKKWNGRADGTRMMPLNSNNESAASFTEDLSFIDDKSCLVEARQNIRDERNGIVTQATLLFVVTIALEASDVVFALDSTAVKMAVIPDVFLAYTSTVMAISGLRALFVFVETLIESAPMMKYGLTLILILTGVKICLEKFVEVPPLYFLASVMFILCLNLVVSVLSSLSVPSQKQCSDTKDVVQH